MLGRIAISCLVVLALLPLSFEARSVAAGDVAHQGDLRAWGFNDLGQLGTSTTTGSGTPLATAGVEAVTAVAAGGSHSLALLADGTVQSWGWNGHGQLGNTASGPCPASPYSTPTVCDTTPTRVAGLGGVVAVAAGGAHSLALLADGTVRAWGANYSAQLGDGSRTDSSTPALVDGLGGVIAISAGIQHNLTVLGDGTVMGWGWNSHGELGWCCDNESATPVAASGVSGATAVAAGWRHSLALLRDGTVMAWGANYFGELGNGQYYTSNSTPALVPGLSGVVAIAAGDDHSLALLKDGTIRAWGQNASGQVGDVGATSSLPVPVPGLSGVVAIAAHGDYSLALLADGTVRAWGGNEYGQLGNGGGANSRVPVAVSGLSGVVGIAAGSRHSLAIVAASSRFTDVSVSRRYHDAIIALADRGIIRGYGDGHFGPDDHALRAQSAAFIARAVGWDTEDWPDTTFPDQGVVDDDLWRNVRTLAHYRVALGYGDGTYNPTGEILEQQVILFIARAMIAKNFWIPQADTNPYPNLPNTTEREQADRRDIATYVYYVGAVPYRPIGQPWAEWDQPATRGWYAQVLWAALAVLAAL